MHDNLPLSIVVFNNIKYNYKQNIIKKIFIENIQNSRLSRIIIVIIIIVFATNNFLFLTLEVWTLPANRLTKLTLLRVKTLFT